MINIELIFNKDIQHFSENRFEELNNSLNASGHLPKNHGWDFGTGCSALSFFEDKKANEIITLLKNWRMGNLKISKIKKLTHE